MGFNIFKRKSGLENTAEQIVTTAGDITNYINHAKTTINTAEADLHNEEAELQAIKKRVQELVSTVQQFELILEEVKGKNASQLDDHVIVKLKEQRALTKQVYKEMRELKDILWEFSKKENHKLKNWKDDLSEGFADMSRSTSKMADRVTELIGEEKLAEGTFSVDNSKHGHGRGDL